MDDRDREPSREAEVPRALGRLRVALDASFAGVAAGLGLTAQQAELLCAALAPARIGEVATVLRCDRSNVTRLADRAAARGLLRRRAASEDGRARLLELSPEGEQLARRFIDHLEQEVSDLLERWPESRRHTAVEIINEISDALEARHPPPR